MTQSAFPNYDPETFCHFGVISQHSIGGDQLSEIFDNGRNLSYESAVDTVKQSLRSALSDYFSDYKHSYQGRPETSKLEDAVESAWDAIADDWNDGYDGCGEETYLYEQDGYKISNSVSLVCLFVEKSPYYTYTRGCSPCAPNAGDLDNPAGELKTYCLNGDWFEDEKAPYDVYSVATDAQLSKSERGEVAL